MSTSRMSPRHRLVALCGVGALGIAALSGCSTPAMAGSAVDASSSRSATAEPGSDSALVAATTNLPQDGSTLDRPVRARLRHFLHGTWVTGPAAPVTHSAIRGTVTAVSATSITVRARDGVTLTFAVTDATKVHRRGDGRGTFSPIDEVHVGDEALVTGVGDSTRDGTGEPTARHIFFGFPQPSTPLRGSSPAPSEAPVPSS